jgi:AcrR family transcriptional regulator
VAREAGVSAALVHNHYPDVAAAIREAMGQSERVSREAKNQELKVHQARARELNDEVKALRADVARLASINEVLMAENTNFKAIVGASGTVMSLSPTSRRSNS